MPRKVTLHYCYVCHKRKSSPPDSRCRKCRAEGREFVSFSGIPAELDKIEARLKDVLKEIGA